PKSDNDLPSTGCQRPSSGSLVLKAVAIRTAGGSVAGSLMGSCSLGYQTPSCGALSGGMTRTFEPKEANSYSTSNGGIGTDGAADFGELSRAAASDLMSTRLPFWSMLYAA